MYNIIVIVKNFSRKYTMFNKYLKILICLIIYRIGSLSLFCKIEVCFYSIFVLSDIMENCALSRHAEWILADVMNDDYIPITNFLLSNTINHICARHSSHAEWLLIYRHHFYYLNWWFLARLQGFFAN